MSDQTFHAEALATLAVYLQRVLLVPSEETDDTYFEKLYDWLGDLVSSTSELPFEHPLSLSGICADGVMLQVLSRGIEHPDSRIRSIILRTIGVIAACERPIDGHTSLPLGIFLLSGVSLHRSNHSPSTAPSSSSSSSLFFSSTSSTQPSYSPVHIFHGVLASAQPHKRSELRVYVAALSAIAGIASTRLGCTLLCDPSRIPTAMDEVLLSVSCTPNNVDEVLQSLSCTHSNAVDGVMAAITNQTSSSSFSSNSTRCSSPPFVVSAEKRHSLVATLQAIACSLSSYKAAPLPLASTLSLHATAGSAAFFSLNQGESTRDTVNADAGAGAEPHTRADASIAVTSSVACVTIHNNSNNNIAAILAAAVTHGNSFVRTAAVTAISRFMHHVYVRDENMQQVSDNPNNHDGSTHLNHAVYSIVVDVLSPLLHFDSDDGKDIDDNRKTNGRSRRLCNTGATAITSTATTSTGATTTTSKPLPSSFLHSSSRFEDSANPSSDIPSSTSSSSSSSSSSAARAQLPLYTLPLLPPSDTILIHDDAHDPGPGVPPSPGAGPIKHNFVPKRSLALVQDKQHEQTEDVTDIRVATNVAPLAAAAAPASSTSIASTRDGVMGSQQQQPRQQQQQQQQQQGFE